MNFSPRKRGVSELSGPKYASQKRSGLKTQFSIRHFRAGIRRSTRFETRIRPRSSSPATGHLGPSGPKSKKSLKMASRGLSGSKKVEKESKKSPKSPKIVNFGLFFDSFSTFSAPGAERPREPIFGLVLDFGPEGPK